MSFVLSFIVVCLYMGIVKLVCSVIFVLCLMLWLDSMFVLSFVNRFVWLMLIDVCRFMLLWCMLFYIVLVYGLCIFVYDSMLFVFGFCDVFIEKIVGFVLK